KRLDDITAAGGQLIAISPQKPDGSQLMIEKHMLTFDVLSDANNTVAHRYGLVYRLQDDFRALLTSFGVDLAKINGDDSGELPIPATFVIGRDRRVLLVAAEVDFRKRLSPKLIIEALDAANSQVA
ncbi:MAG: redoxin domain-containing protein, partial [Rhizobiaceae bacterium]|nr:redoxin domain-containing protein [Rhizobiaceae bacterium]